MQRRRITSRRSPVHGKGVFALLPVAAGERLIEYTGEVTSWRRAAARQRADDGHTFVFGLSDGRVIDGSRGGNSARFINHACAPNCEAIETGQRVFIHALVDIQPGDELFIDYGLSVDGEITDELRAHYACRCGATGCRQSMLAAVADSGCDLSDA
ncbi:MAG TPA: SET domain-containing protein-lysine N-methyltransferase [Paraburkholderia sp.]|uniref:SET domain-containing protein n=1 Tax=Paraburkholderia sp. TaxID=1926495 RepID=UPI002B469919|nr:SET domain-containing protein-lysine N-methyltransferase [Paraburkholderia sp.]HKR40904.1 SET domain-containing protein-lysine N-methyltransferase [Paraburkholderia sp.]